MPDQEISMIGEYQLGNLISNQVPFLYYYIQSEDSPRPAVDHPLLQGVQSHVEEGMVDSVSAQASDEQHPIVLVCQDGLLSLQVAQTLMVAGYKNVFVVQGGVNEFV